MKHGFAKVGTASAAALLMALASANAAASAVQLSGTLETPAVETAASGSGDITVGADHTVSGSIATQGITGTVAHIHSGAPGQKGPPVITLTKVSDSQWAVPPGSKFSDEDYAAYQAGNLYVNVHSADHKGGEIRGQLKP
ncbi:MAG: CHRD domain-containing protein [Nevskia sp.]|nr:CHRD domain-containing protein [Nevskia sp.]